MGTQLPKITIEPLTRSTLKWFIEVASVRMLAEEVKRPELINLDGMYSVGATILEDDTGFIAREGDGFVGAIAGVLTPNLFNPDLTVLAEVMWYVLPEYRKTRAGLLLLNAFIEKGEQEADETTFSLLKESPIKTETLEKRGFQLSEFSFIKQTKG